jgi:hypothetical protein
MRTPCLFDEELAMKRDEFESSEPLAERIEREVAGIEVRSGDETPEAGCYACVDCLEAVTATLVLLEKGQQVPICNTCGAMSTWRKQPS